MDSNDIVIHKAHILPGGPADDRARSQVQLTSFPGEGNRHHAGSLTSLVACRHSDVVRYELICGGRAIRQRVAVCASMNNDACDAMM